MKEKKTADGYCPECGRVILADAGKCGFCGYQLTSEEVKAAKAVVRGGWLFSREDNSVERVVITGIDIGFFSLTVFLTRLMLAAIPALIMAGFAIGFLCWFWLPLFTR